MTITADDFLETMREAMTVRPGKAAGLSTAELMELTGKGEVVIKAAMRKIQAEGRLVVRQDKRLAIDGRYRPIPVYSIKEAEAGR